uniref:ShKT domain-containing protein n=1 Tax=Bursaphelenchus xylophilus TaxID=6326 RepID=A0A1I7RMH7_BURXY
MKTYCPLTCNYCRRGQPYYDPIDGNSIFTTTTPLPPLPGPTVCVDAYTSCLQWARNGFCTNGFYTIEQRRNYCGRTCSLCT